MVEEGQKMLYYQRWVKSFSWTMVLVTSSKFARVKFRTSTRFRKTTCEVDLDR